MLPFLPFVQSRTVTCGMVPPVFKMSLPPQVRQFRNSLTDVARGFPVVILEPAKLTGKVNHNVGQKSLPYISNKLKPGSGGTWL